MSEQRVSKEVHESVTIASSKGWVCLKNIRDSSLRLTNVFNLASSVVSLPPVDVERGEVSSLCLSVSPDEEGGDCVVAVTLSACMLGLCRPGDSEWTYMKMKKPESKVMFSVTDKTFYVNKVNETETETETTNNFPPVSPYPRLTTHQFRELMNVSTELRNLSCFPSEYLVEAPSGESFLVFLVRERWKPRDKSSWNTKSFIVFRRDGPGSEAGAFTRDIGNLCIFLGDKSEAFCVSATDYPGLHPNSVYFGSFGSGFGFFDLSSLTLHDLTDSAPQFSRYSWLAPLH